MLVRGGPGAGKSVLATDLALRLGKAVGGDVLYVCVEILPSEVVAQRMGFDGFDPSTTVDLAYPDARKSGDEGPTLVVGMTEMEGGPSEGGDGPDLGRMILDLVRLSVERGFDPRVVVVDSLSDGYGLGSKVPRSTVDGVCKLAVEQGWALVLVEETVDQAASPWSFAVDTVLSLAVTDSGRREVRVTKHRFGPCQPGPHRLLVEREGVRVLPCFAAYRNAVRDLALPPPAANRSLRVPVVGPEPDWASFNVPDGVGRIALVSCRDPQLVQTRLNNLTLAIGKTAPDGSEQSGAQATLHIEESHENPLDSNATGFAVGTLHQMVDGEEWLEAALSILGACTLPLVRVRIGPTDKLLVYEHGETVGKGISLLAAILRRLGFLVVVWGSDANKVIRAAIVDEQWLLYPIAHAAPGQLNVKISFQDQTTEFQVPVA